MSRFQRAAGETGGSRVTSLELFYDLVFVFAVTQVTHHLLEHLTWSGAGQSLLLVMVVWWSWNYTTWVTNELDPDSTAVRLLLIALMLASLILASSIPNAFGEHPLVFVLAYLAIQVGRHGFLAFATADRGTIERERALRILIWFAFAGVFWIGGAFVDGTARTLLWVLALALDYAAPLLLFPVPGRPVVRTSDWTLETAHFAERFGLFLLIALGESIVITGETASDKEATVENFVAFGAAFLTTATFWWLYFVRVTQIAELRLERAKDRTILARDGYTYLHVVLVAGIIVSAVGDELVIAHPDEALHRAELLAVVGGPALYLLGLSLFRLRLTGTVGPVRLLGALGCVLVWPVSEALELPALVVGLLVLAVVVAVLAWEEAGAAAARRRGEPSAIERLRAQAVTMEP